MTRNAARLASLCVTIGVEKGREDMSIRRRIVSGVSAVALASGVLVGASPAAQAAPGDTTFFPTGAGARDIVEDSSGTLWVTNRDGGSI